MIAVVLTPVVLAAAFAVAAGAWSRAGRSGQEQQRREGANR